MTRNLLTTVAAIFALSSLAACNRQGDSNLENAADNAATAAPVVLPPAITASKTYRCKDNSLVYIDWLADGTARVKADKNEVGTAVTLGEAGAPLSGTSTDASVTYKGKSCKA